MQFLIVTDVEEVAGIDSFSVPQAEDDIQWGHRANAYTVGNLKGLVNAVSQSP